MLKRLKSSKGDITYIDIADKLSILKNNLGVKLIYILGRIAMNGKLKAKF